ncbi:MAG TPA: RHS repeat domain-containing protein, partial [Planctomycetaceae bacterium]
YDANGNLTKKTTIASGAYITYTWDYHNRLTDVQAYNSSDVLQSHIHDTYDVSNELIEKQIDPTGGAPTRAPSRLSMTTRAIWS